jgi:hypothetical protein
MKIPFASTVRLLSASIAATQRSLPFFALESYGVPDWFRDAKFGIWLRWGHSPRLRQGTGMLEICISRIQNNTICTTGLQSIVLPARANGRFSW